MNNQTVERKTEKQKVQELTDKLEQGLSEIFNSERYKEYLKTMSKFHNYSFNNTLLISMQNPDATLVAGYQAWQKNFERHVNKGEKAIRILAPAPYKIKKEQEKIDPATNEIMFNNEGMPEKEVVEVSLPAFRVVNVFDVSQTDGKPIPDLAPIDLLGDFEKFEDFKTAIMNVSPVPISFCEIEGDSHGNYNRETNAISIKDGMGESQTIKTMIHEVAHSLLHNKEMMESEDFSIDRNTIEVEAESVAYTVCQHFGLDSSDYSFNYIAGWSSDKEASELKASMNKIRSTASNLIKELEMQLEVLEKQHQLENETLLYIGDSKNVEIYDENNLFTVTGLPTEQIKELLDAMEGHEIISIQDYLESNGAWVIPCDEAHSVTPDIIDIRYYEDKYSTNLDSIEISADQPQYHIMQLKDSEELSPYRFTGTSTLLKLGYLDDTFSQLVPENYDLVYSGNLDEFAGTAQDIRLEKIYEKFNIAHPEDFKGHSLSVGDIVVLSENGNTSAHFVDSFGFTELPEFAHKFEKNRESDIIDIEPAKENILIPEDAMDLGVHVADRYIAIQKCINAYDISIYNEDFHLEDGGISEDIDISMEQELEAILDEYKDLQFGGKTYHASDCEFIDYEELQDKIDEKARMEIASAKETVDKNSEPVLTFIVSECGEFQSLGEFYDGIETIDDAIEKFKSIDPERMHGIPSLGVNLHVPGTHEYDDEQVDLLRGNSIDIDMLLYSPALQSHPTVLEAIEQLKAEFPNAEIIDFETQERKIKALAIEIDRFSYEIDPQKYRECVPDMHDNVQALVNDIKNKDIESMEKFLKLAISSRTVDALDNMVSVSPDNTAREQIIKAQELLDRLAEYKPLAKVEELEEQNYNMIDNVLNNSPDKSQKEEVKKEARRPSLKEKLAAKKAKMEEGVPINENKKNITKEHSIGGTSYGE